MVNNYVHFANAGMVTFIGNKGIRVIMLMSRRRSFDGEWRGSVGRMKGRIPQEH